MDGFLTFHRQFGKVFARGVAVRLKKRESESWTYKVRMIATRTNRHTLPNNVASEHDDSPSRYIYLNLLRVFVDIRTSLSCLGLFSRTVAVSLRANSK